MKKIMLILVLNFVPLLFMLLALTWLPEHCENTMAGLINWLNHKPEATLHSICTTSASELFSSQPLPTN
ncbi:hypothetical protein L4174_017970 [Photobacterium sp. CCB-ST2H9]|uniref:hypothetical protein n=1 Tax=Photobacterium sp. CCB-ST2H9 TaxID=2912855 RepID=UPI0020057F69|nr:hypothetical protein [Photobacterium sp. CCB-ST2H9]UTM59956.1 hypothetical protein L4174_017970 [Photobacterium sp. CCB-ST2H9]